MIKKFFNKFEYNSPVVLTFSLIAVMVYFLDRFLPINLIQDYFTYYGSISIKGFMSLILWPLGHSSFEHLAGNLTILLLIGPMIEKKYSSRVIFTLMLISAIIIGGVQVFIFHVGILGASGIVYMFIVLTSFTSSQKNKIPLTFVAIACIFLGKEMINGIFVQNNVSELSHLIGAAIGIVYDRFLHK